MNSIIYLIYPGLLFYLFWGAKPSKKGEWNSEFLSLAQTKSIQGFCTIAIMIHHIAQKTCAPWIPKSVIRHGLDMFVPIGTFFVGLFFFCSGYGLVKSNREKENYLDGFYAKRMRLILFAFLITNLIYFLVRYKLADHLVAGIPWFFHLNGPALPNNYSWYVLVILYFYIVFYLAFRCCKKEAVSIAIVFIVAVLYMLNCDWWMFGDWWYNTILLFPIGMLFARREKKIVAGWKKLYLGMTPIVGALMVGFLLASEFVKNNAGQFMAMPYVAYRWLVILLQVISVILFVMLVLLMNLKVKVGNKTLSFMGTITLEFYLMHGLFVQIFGFNFFDDPTKRMLYIESVPLYSIVVFALSLGVAIGLKIGLKWLCILVEKKKDLVHYLVFGKWKRNLVVAFIIGAVIVYALASDSKRRHGEAEPLYEAFVQENITYANVEGCKMAAYDVGEGVHTIVFLPSMEDPCPSISYKPLVDKLKGKNRAITFDYLGTGLSDDTDQPRTSENICKEIHLAIRDLGVEGPVVLVSHLDTGKYAQAYAFLYPDDVEALVCVDTYVPDFMSEQLKESGTSPRVAKRATYKTARLDQFKYRISKWTGYTTIDWPGMELMLSNGHTKKELGVMEEVYYRHYMTDNIVDEKVRQYENYEYVKDKPFAEDLPVLFLLSYYTCEGYVFGDDYDWVAKHEEQITNPEIQQYVVVAGDPYVIYQNQNIIARRTQMLIDSLDGVE